MTTEAHAGAVTTTRSPFSLLREADEAEQVLILTYTANLDFFERFALGEARGLQAATTVISDATMVAADPVTVRGAGVRYVDARAVCPGNTAFHPKLLAILGSGRATVAIGSGNLTLAGWHGNEELWTVLCADSEQGPSTIRDVARFLRALGDGRIQLSAETAVALDRAVKLLDGLAANRPGPELVSTLDQEPIINRLPAGPVDELIVYSPYYDAELSALKQIVARTEPTRLVVFVQFQTSVDGPALEGWLAERGAHVYWCAADRFRHGKLIEWSRNEVREALIGSPNLSKRALLRVIGSTPASDGAGNRGPDERANCELGLICRVDGSLTPAEVPAPAGGAARLKFAPGPDDAPRPATVLLGATLIDHAAVHIRLAAPLGHTARIQTHDPERDWTTTPGHPELLAGASDYRVPSFGLPAGAALRLFESGRASNEVFVVDPVRAQQRPYKRVGPDSGSPGDLIIDGGLAVLYEIALLMRPMLLKMGALVPKQAAGVSTESENGNEPEKAAPKPGQTLEEYLAKCATVLDEKVIEWALAIPALPSLGGGTRIDHQGGMLTTEVDDDAADAGDDDEPVEALSFAEIVRKATEYRRGQWRRFCDHALGLAAGWPLLMRAYLARLTLNGIAADLWDDETARGTILQRLVTALAAEGDEPTDEEGAAIASYAAIAIALLRVKVAHMSVDDEPMLGYRAAATAAAAIINDLDPTRVEEIVVEIGEAFDQLITGDEVFDMAAEAMSPPSGISGAIKLLRDEFDVAATEQDGALVLSDPIGGIPERELLRAAGLVTGTDAVVVRGRRSTGGEAFWVWHAPLLLFARRNPAGINGRVYRLGPGLGPKAIAQAWKASPDLDENLPDPIESWYPGVSTPAAAAELLALAGLG